MKTDQVVEKIFSHEFKVGDKTASITAKTKAGHLVALECLNEDWGYTKDNYLGVVTFLLENWEDTQEILKAVREDICDG